MAGLFAREAVHFSSFLPAVPALAPGASRNARLVGLVKSFVKVLIGRLGIVIPAQAGIQRKICAEGAPYLTMEVEVNGSAWGSHGNVHGELRCGCAAVYRTGFPPARE